MTNWKKIGKALLFPHIAIMIVLLPIATVFLVYSMVFMGTNSVIAIVSYVLAFYTLTIWCLRIPEIIRIFKTFKDENRYVRRWNEDTRLRVNVSLYGSFFWNAAYAVFQLGLGFWHRSFWFFSMAGYYICLALMRFYLSRHTRKYAPGERMLTELKKYRICGIVFLIMNMALSLMVFFMVYFDRTFHHHEITTIAMAAYTFTAFTMAIINIVKYRKYESPVYSATKAVSLAAACVSMLTLTSTMLTVFGDGNALKQRIMLGAVGSAVCLFVVVMAIYMIVQSSKQMKTLSAKKE